MLHTTALSDMPRLHQADLLREAQAQAMLKRAGITHSAQPKQLLAVAAFVVMLIVVFLIKSA